MITAHQILEAYETSFKHKNDYVEVFANPDKKELRDAGESIRFSANDCNKTVYVWGANLALHFEARAKAKLPKCGENLVYWWTGILEGVARSFGTEYVMSSSDCFSQGFMEYRDEKRMGRRDNSVAILYSLADILDRDWSWVNRYIKVDGWLDEIKESINAEFAGLKDKRRVQ
jgi:hypothetical protein